MINWSATLIFANENERRTDNLAFGHAERESNRLDQPRFAGAERPFQRDRRAGRKRFGQCRAESRRGLLVFGMVSE